VTVTSDTDPTVGVEIGTLPGGGASVEISFKVTIADSLPAGVSAVANQGLVESNELPPEPTDDPDTLPDDDPTVTPVTAAPVIEAFKQDLLFTDADSDGVPSPGDTLLYEVTIVNSGNQAGVAAFLIDNLDANLTLVVGSVQTSQGSVTSGNTAGDTNVSVDVGTIPAGGEVTISFKVEIDDPLPAGVTQVSNQGLVSGENFPTEPTDDPDTDPDDDPTDTPVTAAPVLEAEKRDTLFTDADNDGVPSPGDTLLYQVTIVNSGNAAATGVWFTDTMDSNTTLVAGSVQASPGVTVTSDTDPTVGVEIGTLPGGGASVVISFKVTIADSLPAGVSAVANQGLVESNELPDEPTDDPDTAPDDDPTDTPVTAAPVIEAFKQDLLFTDADGSGVLSPGDTLLYVVVIDNFGNAGVADVLFTDTPDENTTLVVGSVQASQGNVTSGNTAGDTSVAVDVGTVPAGGQVTISFRVTINEGFPVGVTPVVNQGLVASEELEDEPTDDPDTVPDDDRTVSEVIVPLPIGGTTLPLRVPALLVLWTWLVLLFGLTLAGVAAIVWRSKAMYW
jgi:uncharacterized repeat protein (TIGR01451 family)